MQAQNVLVGKGSVPIEEAKKLDDFNKEVRDVLMGLNPKTTVNSIELKIA